MHPHPGVKNYILRLERVRFRARHGVSDSERSLPQDFLVTLDVTLPTEILPTSDHLRDVFDYDRLASLVVAEGTAHSCRLLETVAERVLQRLWADTPALQATISVTKTRPPTQESVDSATVTLVASRPAVAPS